MKNARTSSAGFGEMNLLGHVTPVARLARGSRQEATTVSERSGTELGAILGALDFRCDSCDRKVLPGASLCIDCKYGPLPVAGDDE